ncbi:MAG: hypothetical protein GWM98_12115, partial [Nitrospinaceae bacterium]|nr:hypothetical protein [Nitrospinaceae bacterium]
AKGLVNILYLDLTPHFWSTHSGGSSKISSETDSGGMLHAPDETGDRIFSRKPIPLDLLRQIDAELDIRAQRLKFKKTDMDNVSISLQLHDGQLDV